MVIIIERNQKIQSLQIIDNIYVCVCVCDYTNLDVKTSKISKKIYNQRMSYWNNLKITRKIIIYIYIFFNVVEEKKITEE